MANTGKQEGICKFFNSQKGFGFLKINNSKEEIFFHHTGLIDEVQKDDHVSFEITEGKKGPNAVNITKI